MAKSELNYTGYPESATQALEVLEILMRAYVPKNTKDANYCLAALNVLRRADVAGVASVALAQPSDGPDA